MTLPEWKKLRCKSKERKKVKEKCCIIATEYAFPPNMECVEVCDVSKFYTFTTVETYFLSPNHCEIQTTKNYQTSK